MAGYGLAGGLCGLAGVTIMLAVGVLHEHTTRVQRAGLGIAVTSTVLITI